MPARLDCLAWILGSGLLMAGIALVGGLFVLRSEHALRRWLEPIIAFAAGALVGGAMFHMLPHALLHAAPRARTLEWVVVGFTLFLALDLLLEWRHCQRHRDSEVRPLAPLLLLADGLHNFLGGLAIGAVFLVDVRAGWFAWLAAALHELPQEIGDFGAIVHAGMPSRRALWFNFLSGLTFPIGGLVAWSVGGAVDVSVLVAIGCGNFLYIAASDLLPEVKRSEHLPAAAGRFAAFVAGLLLLFVLREIAPG